MDSIVELDCSRVTIVLFRTRRRNECLELKEGLGRRVRKSRQKEAAGVCGGRGLSMEFQSMFARKALPEAEVGKRVVVDDHRSIHDTQSTIRLIVTRDRSFFKLATLESPMPPASGTR